MDYYIISADQIKTLRELYGNRVADILSANKLSDHDKQEHADFIAARTRCDKTDCIDYHKELCSPWGCSYYLRNHDAKIQQNAIKEVLDKIQSKINEKKEEFATAAIQSRKSGYAAMPKRSIELKVIEGWINSLYNEE